MQDVVPSGKRVEMDAVRIEILGSGKEGPERAQNRVVNPQRPNKGSHDSRKQGQVPGGSGPDGWGCHEVDWPTIGCDSVSESGFIKQKLNQ